VESFSEWGNKPPGSIKCWEVTEWLHNWRPLEQCSAPWSYLVAAVIYRINEQRMPSISLGMFPKELPVVIQLRNSIQYRKKAGFTI
jgi:hypothetical protein